MKYVKIFVLSFLIGMVSFFGYFLIKNKNNFKHKPEIQIKKQTNSFSIERPPSESLLGSITSRSGTLLWESRIATEPSILTDTIQTKQGERLLTEEKSSVEVRFEGVGSMRLTENSDLSFIQTLPVDFVVEQKRGTITYMTEGSSPLSIRIRSALMTKTGKGEIKVTVNDGDSIILISTIKGTAQIGFNDLDYVSQVFTFKEGQTYEYNSDERTAINSKNK